MIKDVFDEVREGRDQLRGTPWVKIAVGTFVVLALLGVGFRALGVFDEACAVAQEEFGARALLKKYEWLKEAHAQLDKKQADILVYRAGVEKIRDGYAPRAPRSTWAREDREAYVQRSAELSGVIASYNDLAAQYNTAMAEANWRFANVGELPRGADVPLPREYAPYRTE
jgi:hypothetical protein